MALKSTICKAELQVSDLDRHHYATHSLTLARHPSETDERMMVRLFAFALNASEALAFGRGLSSGDEPDLVERDAGGSIVRWIDVGLPDEREVRRRAHRSREMQLFVYGRTAELWWQQNEALLAGLANLRVIWLPPPLCAALTAMAARTMRLSCTIQEGVVWFADEHGSHELAPVVWKHG